MRIDPKNCTNFERTPGELQAFFLFCVFVANKDADQTAKKLETFLAPGSVGELPFTYLRRLIRDNKLDEQLRACRVGQYTRIARAIEVIIAMSHCKPLRELSLSELLTVPGVANKTARYFLLHTQKGHDYAVLDTHIVEYMYWHRVIQSNKPPSSDKKYEEYERRWIELRKNLALPMTAAELDLHIWTEMSNRYDDLQLPSHARSGTIARTRERLFLRDDTDNYLAVMGRSMALRDESGCIRDGLVLFHDLYLPQRKKRQKLCVLPKTLSS